jgi:PD-(D/E)XK endonuclease
MDTNRKGAIAEAEIALEAIRLGIPVLKPVAEHGRYDLGLEVGGRILRVQCKWGSFDKTVGTIRVSLQCSWLSPKGYVRTYYSEDELTSWLCTAGTLTAAIFSPARWLRAGERSTFEYLPLETRNGPASTLQPTLNSLGL